MLLKQKLQERYCTLCNQYCKIRPIEDQPKEHFSTPQPGGGAISVLDKMETNLGALSHSVITVPDIIDNNLKEASPVRAFKFIYTNADTLTNKFDELKTSINNEKPELVAITEVLPKNSQFLVQEQELQIEGYNSVSNLQVADTLSVRIMIL